MDGDAEPGPDGVQSDSEADLEPPPVDADGASGLPQSKVFRRTRMGSDAWMVL